MAGSKFLSALIVSCILCLTGISFASDHDNHQVTVTVSVINELAVAGGNITLTINSATPGSEPNDATDATTSLDWTTNDTGKKITAATDNAAATFTLKVNATAVTGGTSAGQITLSTTDTDYVTGIATTTGGCTSTYTAQATAAQGNGSDVHVVTFTLTDE
ncbi:MAG: hypothetical protein IPP40_11460 [bacterium]|nr:hypothetical protein [bacterium]